MSNFEMERAQEKDASELAWLRILCWKNAYKGLLSDAVLSKLDYERDLATRIKSIHDPAIQNHIARDSQGKIVGFSLAGAARGHEDDIVDSAEIYALYVHPEYMKKGIGKSLFLEQVSELKVNGYSELFIWALESNIAAQRFYEQMGGKLSKNQKISNIYGELYPEIQYRWDL